MQHHEGATAPLSLEDLVPSVVPNPPPSVSKLKAPSVLVKKEAVVDMNIDKENEENFPVHTNSSVKRKTEEELPNAKKPKTGVPVANPASSKLNVTLRGGKVDAAPKPSFNTSLRSSQSSAKPSLNQSVLITRGETKTTIARKPLTSVPSRKPAAVAKPPPKPDPNAVLTDKLSSIEAMLNQRFAADQAQAEEKERLHAERQRMLAETNEAQEGVSEAVRMQNDLLRGQIQEDAVQIQRLKADGGLKDMKIQTLQVHLDNANTKISTLENRVATLTGELDVSKIELATAQSNIAQLETKLKASSDLHVEKDTKIAGLEAGIKQRDEQIASLEAKIRADENVRRKLHNTIQELKGNIRVFCRIRPLLGAEKNDEDDPAYVFPPHSDNAFEVCTAAGQTITGKAGQAKKMAFQFDQVFQPGSSQQQVFDEISQLVQSVLDGYNTCIFTYGQTGSGKTFTMEGPPRSSDAYSSFVSDPNRGMIPRTVEHIFAGCQALESKGWKYEMEAFFLEIYNENIRDLLGKHNAEVKHDIKHEADGRVTVTNLNVVKVSEPSCVYDLLARASANRAVAKTNCNERSSRSHSVFQLRLSGNNSFTGEKTHGILNLIDLAGSERLKESGATGDRLKETQNINKSLSSLGDVICALANKESHIPYRNSRLTHLLQNCLGGNSKTLMFVNVSPFGKHYDESLSSLRFATKVNSCEIGTARKGGKIDLKSN